VRTTRGGLSQRWALLGAIALLALGASGASAQLALPRQETLLFLMPAVGADTDTPFAYNLAHEVRERLRSKLRNKLITYGTDQICDVLTQSAYQCDQALNATDSDRLARAMQADAYILGTVWHDGATPLGQFRLVNLQSSGLAGWMTVRGTPGDSPRSFAATVVDTLDSQIKAAEQARECSERVRRGDFEAALERAERAFAMYPNQPAAAQCAEVASDALDQPIETQIAYLRRAVQGDSLLPRVWERLGRLYQQSADTVAALEAFSRQSMVDANNRELRLGVIAGAITTGNHAIARDLANDWLTRNSMDVEVMQLKTRACVEGGIWDCAFAGLSQQYQIDTSLVGDTLFYQQIIGAVQALGDTAAQLEWSTIAVQHAPQNLSLWRAHASALATAGMTDSVVAVYERILVLDPGDYRSALAAARILLDGVVIDTAVPVDTATLLRGVAFLDRATAATRDTAVLMNVAFTYYQKGSAMVQARRGISLAVDLLERAIQNDVQQRLTVQSNFFLGLGLMFRIFEFDTQVTDSKSCALVDQEAEMVRRGKEALQLGAQLAPDRIPQFMQQFNQFEARIPQLKRAYECR
jgi:tetratricopeptide (TPR) repeat protein